MAELSSVLEDVRKKVEEKLGLEIDDATCDNVLDYTKRKLQIIRAHEEKDDNYLLILFENELEDYFMRCAINMKSALMRLKGAAV